MIGPAIGNVYLVGFMGSGKTTVGRLLAAQLGHAFLDLDTLVERRAGRSIASIFADPGETRFRELETEILSENLEPEPHVMAVGGGTFSSAHNRRLLRSRGWTAWLQVSAEESWRRCSFESGRPLARDRERFLSLFEQRQSDYGRCDVRVRTEDKGPDEICSEVLAALLERTESK